MHLINCQEVLHRWGEKINKELSVDMRKFLKSDFYGAMNPTKKEWEPSIKLFSSSGVL